MNKPTIFLTAMLFALTATTWAGVKNVAVVETEVDVASGAEAALNKAEVRTITSVLRKEAIRSLSQQKYNIMTSETVIAQGGAVLEECADENCVISLGSKIGADYIVRGTVSKFGAKLTVSVDIYETDDGNLVASSDLVKSDKIEELLELTAKACADMYKAFELARDQTARRGAGQPTQEATAAPTPAVAVQQPVYKTTPSTPKPPPPPIKYGSLRDSRDGKTYKTVVIGGKMWMAENLNYEVKKKSWCYDNNRSNCDKYGRLYDWKTAKTACPAGFHLPSRQEWDDLGQAAGGKRKPDDEGNIHWYGAGKKLMARSGWNNREDGSNGNGTDVFGFSALPGGYRLPAADSFDYAGGFGFWWTATAYSNNNTYYNRDMNYLGDDMYENNYYTVSGLSVRCIQD